MHEPVPPLAEDSPLIEGTVIRTTGSWHEVQAGDTVIQARMRGKFRMNEESVTNPVAVGDRVRMALQKDQTGWIMEVCPRENKLSRRAAGRKAGQEHIIVSNVDAVWCVQAAQLPRFSPGFVDRVLVMAEAYHIPAGLIINKSDLLNKPRRAAKLQHWAALYTALGYPVLWTSTIESTGLDALAEALAGKTSVLTGPSGAGKSSLLNLLAPGLVLRTGAVSKKTQRGRHTTTFAALHALGEETFVVDTPGIREFGVWDMAPAELGGYFIEFRPYLSECRFQNCTHDHEPACAVQAAVEAGHIAPERHQSYLNILWSLGETPRR